MFKHLLPKVFFWLSLAFYWVVGSAADLSPQRWPKQQRLQAEQAEAASPSPRPARMVTGESGLVVSSLSPVAALAGVETLKQGGTAADAAIATALTQITLALGTNISYAGILEVTYYDAKSQQTYALNAGWDAWSAETDRASIPLSAAIPVDAGVLGSSKVNDAGRRTLVPGFMAGIEALHAKFGKLKFAELFAPAISYADNGITLSPLHGSYFTAYSNYLAHTSAGQKFIRQGGNDAPHAGDRFVQPELASTLRAVARNGAREMYSGNWAHEFVEGVTAAGGKASLEDMAHYRVIWSEPAHMTFRGHDVRLSLTSVGGQAMLESLNLIEYMGLADKPAYSRNADTLLNLSRAITWATIAANAPQALDGFRAAGVDVSPTGRLTSAYAQAVKPVLSQLFVSPLSTTTPATSPHSAAVVVVDSRGNVASMIHTSNTVAWGSTGIVVGGVPIPEAAGLTALRWPAVTPGGRIPHDMAPLIVFKKGGPRLAIATIGSSLVQETIGVLLSLTNEDTVSAALSAPPILLNGSHQQSNGTVIPMLQVPANRYPATMLEEMRTQGINLKECNPQETMALRGTPAVARILGRRGKSESAEVSGVFNFAAGY